MNKRKLIAIVLAVFMVIFAVSCKNEASEPTVDDNVYVAPEGYLGAWVMDVEGDGSSIGQIVLNDDGTCTLMGANFDDDGALTSAFFSGEYSYEVYEGTGVDDAGNDSGLTDFSIICTEDVDSESSSSLYIVMFYDNATGNMYYKEAESPVDPAVNYTDEVFGDMPKFSGEVKRPEYLLKLADDQSDIAGVWMSSETDNYVEYIFKDGKVTVNGITLTSAASEEWGEYRSYVDKDGDGYFVRKYVENKVTKSEKLTCMVCEYAGEKYLSQNGKGFLKKIEESNYDELKNKISDITGAYTCAEYTYYKKSGDDWTKTEYITYTDPKKAGKLYLGIENNYAQEIGGSGQDKKTSVSYDGRSILIADADGTYALSKEENLKPEEVEKLDSKTYADEASVKAVYSTYKKGEITFTPENGFARTWTYSLLVKKADNSKVLKLVSEEGNTKVTITFETAKG